MTAVTVFLLFTTVRNGNVMNLELWLCGWYSH